VFRAPHCVPVAAAISKLGWAAAATPHAFTPPFPRAVRACVYVDGVCLLCDAFMCMFALQRMSACVCGRLFVRLLFACWCCSVMYPAFPQILYYSPELMRLQMVPHLEVCVRAPLFVPAPPPRPHCPLVGTGRWCRIGWGLACALLRLSPLVPWGLWPGARASPSVRHVIAFLLPRRFRNRLEARAAFVCCAWPARSTLSTP
jgi:hypothetical protein